MERREGTFSSERREEERGFSFSLPNFSLLSAFEDSAKNSISNGFLCTSEKKIAQNSRLLFYSSGKKQNFFRICTTISCFLLNGILRPHRVKKPKKPETFID